VASDICASSVRTFNSCRPSSVSNLEMAVRFLENLYTPLLSHTNINARCPTDKLNIHVAISTYSLYELPARGWEFIFPFWRRGVIRAN